ncbi:unnamed protein product [Closterium sp. NIES-65]|nr:unnamed protein product [Closterium sp. NIES-65]
MATPSVLTFDAEVRAVDFEVWVDDLQLFLQCDRAAGFSLFDLTSGASPAPPADADATVRSQWATRDAAARLAVRRHLPIAERAHFRQYKSAKTLYDTVVARYSSPATAALSRLILPYLFPDLAAFPTVADLITHLRTSNIHYRATLPAKFCAKNPTPLYITLYYIVTRLPDTLRSARDLFLSVCPTTLTVDLLEERLLAAEKSIVARARGARALEGLAGPVEAAVEAAEGVGVAVGVVAGVGALVAAVEAEEAAVVAVRVEVVEVEAVVEVAAAEVELVVAALRRVSAPVVVSASSSALVRPLPPSSFVSGTLLISGVGVLAPVPTAGAAIFDLDYDAILAAMYAVTISDEGDCYRCFPPDTGIETAALGAGEAAALGASASAAPGAGECAAPGAGESALSGTASALATRTFTLDSGASRSFFRNRTTLTLLSRPVAVSLADPSGGPVLAHLPPLGVPGRPLWGSCPTPLEGLV